MPVQRAAQVPPGSTNGGSSMSGAVQSAARPRDEPGPPIVLDLATREGCIGTLERIGRAVLAGRIGSAPARTLIQTVRASLESLPGPSRVSEQHVRNRASTGARIADRRVEADPTGPPPEPDPGDLAAEDHEPTFEELMAAEERKKAAQERAAARKATRP